jgi:hypothetical protein
MAKGKGKRGGAGRKARAAAKKGARKARRFFSSKWGRYAGLALGLTAVGFAAVVMKNLSGITSKWGSAVIDLVAGMGVAAVLGFTGIGGAALAMTVGVTLAAWDVMMPTVQSWGANVVNWLRDGKGAPAPAKKTGEQQYRQEETGEFAVKKPAVQPPSTQPKTQKPKKPGIGDYLMGGLAFGTEVLKTVQGALGVDEADYEAAAGVDETDYEASGMDEEEALAAAMGF